MQRDAEEEEEEEAEKENLILLLKRQKKSLEEKFERSQAQLQASRKDREELKALLDRNQRGTYERTCGVLMRVRS